MLIKNKILLSVSNDDVAPEIVDAINAKEKINNK